MPVRATLVILAITCSTAAASPEPGAVGVWMGVTNGAMSSDVANGRVRFDAAKTKVEWRVFLADGTAFSGLPTVGLADLDVGAHQREAATGVYVGGTWGQWTMGSGRGAAAYPGDVREPLALGKGVLRVGPKDFIRAVNVNGLALDGAYTAFSDPNDPYLDQPGCRQIISFTKDGAFVDRGVFVSDCRKPDYSKTDAAGTGAYEIRDFSLILRYRDGRTVKRSLSGLYNRDPRKDASALFVLGQVWNKRTAALTQGAPAPSGAGVPPAPTAVVPTFDGEQVTFDAVTFTKPQGTQDRSKSAIGYTTVDQRAKTYCQFVVFNSVAGGASAAEDFEGEWKDVIVANHVPDAMPTPAKGGNQGGLRYVAGGSMVTTGTRRAFFKLFVFRVGARRMSVTIASVDERGATRCEQQVDAALQSLRARSAQ